MLICRVSGKQSKFACQFAKRPFHQCSSVYALLSINAKKAKHAARLVARQLAGCLETWREDLTTDAAEACVFGAWACTELGWRDDAIVERFSNGDLRVVAKRPIDVE